MSWHCAAVAMLKRCLYFVLSVGVVAAASTFVSLPAWADDASEIPLGVFHLGGDSHLSGDSGARPEERDRLTGTGPREGGRPGKASGDTTQEGVFGAAVAAFESGRDATAQFLFEKVVAADPMSGLAQSARGYLATLYESISAGARDTARRPVGVPRFQPVAEAEPLDKGPKRGRDETGENGRFLGSTNGEGIPTEGGPFPGIAKASSVSLALEEQFITEAGDRVFFSAGSAELGSRARLVLAAQARFILGRPELLATIEGHADDAPLPAAEHWKLSEARAKAVRERLVAEGLEENRVQVVSFGRGRPVVVCDDPACAAQNRRVVTILASIAEPRRRGARRAFPVLKRTGSPLTH
jgi:outer membrane protein OmpA-like peptidoglycan-associated protein